MGVSPAVKKRCCTKRLAYVLAMASLVCGIILMALNMYGLTQPIRKPGLGVMDHADLRFVPKEIWSYEQSMTAINELSRFQSKQSLAEEAAHVVNLSLIHVDWMRVQPAEYRQLIPVWENYFLYWLGRFSGLPQFERYHYANYQRNIQRGIGICGDASTVLSSILDRYGVINTIVSFERHVIVEYKDDNGDKYLLDPDFGILLGVSLEQLVERPERVAELYLNAGYSQREVDFLLAVFSENYTVYNNTYSFMSKRYLFERVSYAAKWIVPVLLIVLAFWVVRKLHRVYKI
jgi:hypothetical protein